MTIELVAGLTLMVLLAVISGRRMGTRLFGFSCFSVKICVTIWPVRAGAGAGVSCTVPVCSRASASGTTFSSPPVSISAKPRPRSADR